MNIISHRLYYTLCNIMAGLSMSIIVKGDLNISRREGIFSRKTCSNSDNTLLKSNVTTWSVGGRCRGSQECGSRFVNFACQFHARWHAVSGSSHNSEIYNIGARAQ